MSQDFASRLFDAIDRVGNPAMVGLDPRLDHLPEPFKSAAQQGVEAAAQALVDYHCALLDVLADKVAVVKPQAAFFETLGAPGFQALARAVEHAKERGLLVVMDAKRGDIGSTSAAYAQAFLSGEVFPASDALTVNPYLGEDACEPFVRACAEHQTGLFILVKTSNPGASLFQDHGEPPLADRVAEAVVRWGEMVPHQSWSSIGAVVGATRPDELAHFRRQMPKVPLLLPGFGFQGGGAEGLDVAFDAKGHGAVVNSSRGVLWAHEREDLQHLADWQERTAVAVDEMVEALRAVQGARA
ncbi:MAG: orotidine-5'-phosphate decarboxylase [Planctomycetes bacterium]|nr:orotidine-5'-phosphate decarboxylase [Planctomycetota bacterium]